VYGTTNGGPIVMKLKIIKENFDKAMNEVNPERNSDQRAQAADIKRWYMEGFGIYLNELMAKVGNDELQRLVDTIFVGRLEPKQFAMSLENQKIDLDPKL